MSNHFTGAAHARGDSETAELRGDVSRDLLQALDALAKADRDQSRIAYVIGVLEKHVADELHRLILLNRMLRGNPLLADKDRNPNTEPR